MPGKPPASCPFEAVDPSQPPPPPQGHEHLISEWYLGVILVRLHILHPLLAQYLLQAVVNHLCGHFTYGFCKPFTGPFVSSDYFSVKSAIDMLDVVAMKVKKQCTEGHIAGLFNIPHASQTLGLPLQPAFQVLLVHS